MLGLNALINLVRAAAAARMPALPVMGTPVFLGQHTNPDRNKQRKVCKRLGHRQYRMRLKAYRRAAGGWATFQS